MLSEHSALMNFSVNALDVRRAFAFDDFVKFAPCVRVWGTISLYSDEQQQHVLPSTRFSHHTFAWFQ